MTTHGFLGLPHEASSRASSSRTTRRPLLVLAFVLALVSFGTGAWLLVGNLFVSADPVREAEARAFLDRAVEAGISRDFDALCRLNGAQTNCEWTLEQVRDVVPSERPGSIKAQYIPTGPGVDVPGWMFTVTGRDGRGTSYETEIMVFREGSHLKAINIVWWSGARLVLNDVERQTAQPVN